MIVKKQRITIDQIMIAIYNNSESKVLQSLIEDYGEQQYELGSKDQQESSQSYFN